MKKALLSILAAVICVMAGAQATQPCVVKQYNQKEQKTPLAGVEVMVSNAGSQISDKDGVLTLRFRTLKPGDHVTVYSITKSGYEVFNTDAVEQWNIARDNTPFLIVLVKSDYFARLKQSLKETSVSSYESKYKQAKAELDKLQKEGKMKAEEYDKKLTELEDRYENQLSNIDSYIDVFARFDLSEMSAEEERIIEMVHNGQIDEAVKEYDKLKIIERYEAAVDNRDRLSRHIDQAITERDRQQQMADSIMAIMQRQQVTLTEMAAQLKREDMTDPEKYRQFVKSALETIEILYASDPDRYRADLDMLREEWERITKENN